MEDDQPEDPDEFDGNDQEGTSASGAEIARFVANTNATNALMKVWVRCGLNISAEIPNPMNMAFEIMDFIDDLEEKLKKARRR